MSSHTIDSDPDSSAAAEADLDAQYREAVSQGVLPDTPLAREVFGYWKRFPDAILLMRVGKFYEVRRPQMLPLTIRDPADAHSHTLNPPYHSPTPSPSSSHTKSTQTAYIPSLAFR